MLTRKFWSRGDDFAIRDENKPPVYIVDGKVFS